MEDYFDARVFGPRGFCCAHAEECKASAVRPGVEFFEGQLSYLGHHYDVLEEDRPMRVLIVSMEVGMGPPHVSMSDRDPQVRVRIGEPFSARNPHMRGVTLALQLAYGLPLGGSPASERLGTRAGTVHVLDAFAMANLLLCSAAAPGKKSRATDTMRRNCFEHLAATIKILEPTVVISQGSRATGSSVESELRRSLDVQNQHGERVWTASVDGTRFIWVPLRHPTYNWDWLSRPYLQEVAAPAIKLGRSIALQG